MTHTANSTQLVASTSIVVTPLACVLDEIAADAGEPLCLLLSVEGLSLGLGHVLCIVE